MKLRLKRIEDILRDFEYLSSKNRENSDVFFPVAVVDTGAVIDIVRATREYGKRVKKGDSVYGVFRNPSQFLEHVDQELVNLIVLPVVNAEIDSHKEVMINSHTPELSEKTLQRVKMLAQKSFDFMRKASFIDKAVGDGDIGYDVHNISQEACRDHPKKDHEGYSRVDKEILAYAAFLSRAYLQEVDGRRQITRVIVLSPDQHLISGVELMQTDPEFSKKYKDVGYLSTRREVRR